MKSFTVVGKPVPKPRPRVQMRGRHPHIYTPTTPFENDVGWEAKRARVKPTDGLVAISLRFFGHATADADNLAKAVLDGLNGIAYADDKQVVELHVYVDRAGKPARTEVTIRTNSEVSAWRRERGCDGKTKHTYEEAERILEKTAGLMPDGKPGELYYCEFCGWHHVGHLTERPAS